MYEQAFSRICFLSKRTCFVPHGQWESGGKKQLHLAEEKKKNDNRGSSSFQSSYLNSGQEKPKIQKGNLFFSGQDTAWNGRGNEKAENIYSSCRIKVLSQSTFTLWMKEMKSSQMYTVLCLFFIPFPRGAVWGVSTCNGGIKLQSTGIFLCFFLWRRTVGHRVGFNSMDELFSILT